MASNGESVHGNSVVRYDSTHSETVNVDIESQAKNHAQGRALGQSKGRRRTLILFERASTGSWWNPKFDSVILEKAVLTYYFPDTRRRFQYALIYLILASLGWAIFFGNMRLTPTLVYYLAGSIVLGVVAILVLIFTRCEVYERFVFPTSLLLSVLLSAFLLSTFAFDEPKISLVGTFGGTMGILLLNYTLFPMPLYVCAPLGVLLSVAYEVLVVFCYGFMDQGQLVACKVLLHLTLHLLGIHIFIITQVRCRSNFWKVVQCAKARTDLLAQKQNLDNMIHSLMPKSVADQVMTSRSDKDKDRDENGDDLDDGSKKRNRSKRIKGEIIFRSFNMTQMQNVSILFADIVGFTKMSSNKTAEHLVGLLNDLFGRFDELCTRAKCEKISTLGDCYYCVAGCPEPQPDHAECCVKMGLGMITAIKEFDEDNNESVNMRVGVHTGTVSCGIVGTRRFKFDVWSNDVTLANMMESTGRPGMVHISDASYELLKDKFEVEPGEEVEDLRSFKKLIEHYDPSQSSFTIRHEQEQRVIKTYFITGVKPGTELIRGPRPRSVFIAPESAHAEDMQMNSVAETLDTSGATASANHSDQESLMNDGRVKVSAGKHIGSSEGVDQDKLDDKDDHVDSTTIPFNQSWSVDKAHHRDQADQELINHLSKNKELREFYSRLPINSVTVFFNRRLLEQHYRCHYFEAQDQFMVASPRVQSFIEMLVSLLLFLLISICGFLVFNQSAAFIGVFVVCLMLEVVVLIAFWMDIRSGFLKKLWQRGEEDEEQPRLVGWWKVHNIVAIVIATLPALTIYANLDCQLVLNRWDFQDLFLCFCLLVSLLSFCNFSMSCYLVKSLVAVLVGLALLVLLNVRLCDVPPLFAGLTPQVSNNNTVSPLPGTAAMPNTTAYPMAVLSFLFMWENKLRIEIILNVLLILLLVMFLNREFEISYRLSFHGSAQADKDIRCMQESKAQADWLLHNIIPVHVSDVVKRTHKYSKNHVDVGVIFATIVNFNEFYDESFEGGREYLRVLNELVSDYEELLDRPCFKDVEKIKTISSSFMAASGLNEMGRQANRHPNAHLFALMDFSVELQNAVVRFNESILNFNFELKIGYNYGEVTAGVIGTTKLLYDIWGDTVNIASRMYSTGEHDRIQVPESTLAKLDEMFEFEYRGEIYVKGKGDMKTYLYKCRRPGANWE